MNWNADDNDIKQKIPTTQKSRQDSSLGALTKRFSEMLRNAPEGKLDLNAGALLRFLILRMLGIEVILDYKYN